MEDKPIFWIGSSRENLREFPKAVRRKAGVQEIRIRTKEAYRIFFAARFEEAVYVLHAFQKKTQKTSKQDVLIGQRRYKAMLTHRQEQEG